jgi:hypothetical protein
MASGHVNRASRPNTWLLRPTLQVKILLANPEPSTHGPASLAPLAQANGEDDHRDGEDKYKQRGHALETTSTSALAHWIVGAATHQDCRHRARQQARQDHNRSNLPR